MNQFHPLEPLVFEGIILDLRMIVTLNEAKDSGGNV